ncbi:MAG: tetratricopeptide repeat protein [Brevinematia bacterium]
MIWRSLFVFLLLILFCQGYSSDISSVIDYISVGDYSNAINTLLKLPRSQENSRIIDYYLCELYFLLKDFDNAIRFGEKVVDKKDDFLYRKSLYNVVFSSYMVNDFSRAYRYGIEYLYNVGDSQGIESIILSIVVNSLQLVGKIAEAKEVLVKYKDKYPNLYTLLSNNLSKFASKNVYYKSDESKFEAEKLKFYSEIIRDIISSLEEISSKKNIQLEKLNDIFELLELKEELLKIRKYNLMIDK